MTDDEYERVRILVRRLAIAQVFDDLGPNDGALFVAYCAEWFRRESSSTSLRWDDPAPDLFPGIPYPTKQQLTVLGLDYWHRPLRRTEHAREFLLTVALEGGFPVRILSHDTRGWLKDYLRTLLRRAIAGGMDSADELHRIAEEERWLMAQGYQHDDFVALCSELATSLLELRREAESAGAGDVRNSAILDARRPGWREELPIYVPEDPELVDELLTGLLDERMTGIATEGVEARRFLVKRDGVWGPAVQLLADGEIPSAKLPPGLLPHGRVRAIPTGELGRHLPGELALLEPPVGGQSRWRVRAFMRGAKILTDYPFTVPVSVTLTSPNDAPRPWTWPRGEALRSDVLVFRPDDTSTAEEPLLRFLRAGSASHRSAELYVLYPDDWDIEPAADEAIPSVEELPGLGRKLAILRGTAYLRAREGEGPRFRIEPNTEARERELEIPSARETGFALADERRELGMGSVRPRIREGHSERAPQPGELFVRRPGGAWAPLSGPISGTGLVELSWRDVAADIQIEKRVLALVPEGARIMARMTGAAVAEVRMAGLPGWTVRAADAPCVADPDDPSVISVQFDGRPLYRLPMVLRPPSGHAFEIVVPVTGRDAIVVLADGSIVRPNAQVDIGTLRGAFALSPSRTVLDLTAPGFGAGGASAAVYGELPLGVLRGALDDAFATLSEQDERLRLYFLGDSRPPIRISRFREERLTRVFEKVRWLAPPGEVPLLPVARMVLHPLREHALEHEADGIWRIPERCSGLCLVYLRDGPDVVSRPVPVYVERSEPSRIAIGPLVAALSVPEFNARQDAISAALAGLGRGDSGGADLTWLLDAVAGLNGLPANAFDALKALPDHPEALVRLLLLARDPGERNAVWSLQSQLPFLWLALPLTAWQTAIGLSFIAAVALLEPIFGAEKAAAEAISRLDSVRDELGSLEPAIWTVFAAAGRPSADAPVPPPLGELTRNYVAQQLHGEAAQRNDFAARLGEHGLPIPSAVGAMAHTEFAGLFAPVLLAASACARLRLDRDLALLARRTLREDPAYVSAAWPHLLKFYGTA